MKAKKVQVPNDIDGILASKLRLLYDNLLDLDRHYQEDKQDIHQQINEVVIEMRKRESRQADSVTESKFLEQ